MVLFRLKIIVWMDFDAFDCWQQHRPYTQQQRIRKWIDGWATRNARQQKFSWRLVKIDFFFKPKTRRGKIGNKCEKRRTRSVGAGKERSDERNWAAAGHSGSRLLVCIRHRRRGPSRIFALHFIRLYFFWVYFRPAGLFHGSIVKPCR